MNGTFWEAKPVANVDTVWKGESKNTAMKGTLLEAKPAATVDAV
jgi:hypothetical protein